MIVDFGWYDVLLFVNDIDNCPPDFEPKFVTPNLVSKSISFALNEGWFERKIEIEFRNGRYKKNKRMIKLEKTTKKDLEILFVFQTNKDGIMMAAFTSENPNDKIAYLKKWSAIVENPKINMQTIRLENKIVGSVIHFDMMNETNVSYWIDQKFWGMGIATKALNEFINNSDKRPLFGRVAFDNFGSQKVLEKCGFKSIAKEKGFANARKKEIEEFVYKLD